MDTLSTKLDALAAFDATPAGSALKAYRDALQVTQFMPDTDPRCDEAWAVARSAERDLVAEIKVLQRSADRWHELGERAYHLAMCVFKGQTKADHTRAQHNAAVLANDIDHTKQQEHLEGAGNG